MRQSTSVSTNEEARYDPHRAAKDLEVGNYYLKQKNYRAALERFRDALLYKPEDAEATYGLAVTQEKMDLFSESYKAYSRYLEILPQGPLAKESEEGMKRTEQHLSAETVKSTEATMVREDLAEGEKHLARNEYDAARQNYKLTEWREDARAEDGRSTGPDSARFLEGELQSH